MASGAQVSLVAHRPLLALSSEKRQLHQRQKLLPSMATAVPTKVKVAVAAAVQSETSH